jgi:hypothetical protein
MRKILLVLLLVALCGGAFRFVPRVRNVGIPRVRNNLMKVSMMPSRCSSSSSSSSSICSGGSSSSSSSISRLRVNSVNGDGFSDDLFDDEEEEEEEDVKAIEEAKKSNAVNSKRSYIDQDWQMSADDQEGVKNFKMNTENVIDVDDAGADADDGPAVHVPCFALMYKFKPKYFDGSVDSVLADHKGYCSQFKRLLNSEVLNIGSAKGVVLLWAGLEADDKAATKADVMKFIEDDPLILQEVVEKWDVIDLEEKEDEKNDSPGDAKERVLPLPPSQNQKLVT